MRIHIPSNEAGLEMSKTDNKRSRKQGKGNPRARVQVKKLPLRMSGESAKELMISLLTIRENTTMHRL